MSTPLKLRPHHLLDIISAYGEQGRPPGPDSTHAWGAPVAQVSRQVLSDIDQDITVVHQVDSICEPCAKLINGICQTQLSDELLMRDYNDPLDAGLFELLNLEEGQQLSVREFLQRVQGKLDAVVQLFTRGDRELRRTRTRNALKMLRI